MGMDDEYTGREVLMKFASLSPQQIAELLQKMDGASANSDFMVEISRMLIPRLKEFSSTHFTSITSTYASWSTSARTDKKQRGGLFASVGRAALARHGSFAPVQLTALLAILSEMRLVHVDLFNAAAQFLSTRAKELRPVDVMRVLRSFAKCAVQHEVLCRVMGDEVVSRARDRSVFFKVEDLCEIAWSFCILQYY